MKKSSTTVPLFSTAALFFILCVCAWAAPLRNWPDMSLGQHDRTVRVLQYLLSAQGQRVPADGFFGRGTQKALRQFQQAHQLVATGETNDPTWEVLVVSLHQGSKGLAVRAAQLELREAGYAAATDGVFGLQMKKITQKYQKQTGHTADGVIGRNTWYELVAGDGAMGD